MRRGQQHCTVGDKCTNGTCMAGASKLCDDGNPCTKDSCVASKGCVFEQTTSPCNDGDSCTTGETCSGGKCSGGQAKVCDDGDKCTKDSCDPKSGKCVSSAPIPGCSNACANASECSDGKACTKDSCVGGKCLNQPVVCDDGDACTNDKCNVNTGKCDFVKKLACLHRRPVRRWGQVHQGLLRHQNRPMRQRADF